MTARYALYEIENLSDRFNLASGVPSGTKRLYNISPTDTAPVILLRDGAPEIERKKWGFIPQNSPNANSVFRYKTFAARSEVVFSKTSWERAIRHQRCLIPANGFYEWYSDNNGKHPYFVQLRDQSLFAIAGIYSSWTDPTGKEWGTYAAVTIDAHSSSMHSRVVRPIILNPSDEANWIDTAITDVATLYSMMKSYSDEVLTITKVSDAINSTKPNTPDLIKAV